MFMAELQLCMTLGGALLGWLTETQVIHETMCQDCVMTLSTSLLTHTMLLPALVAMTWLAHICLAATSAYSTTGNG